MIWLLVSQVCEMSETAEETVSAFDESKYFDRHAPIKLLSGTEYFGEILSVPPGRFACDAYVGQDGAHRHWAALVDTFASKEIEAMCKNAFEADGPRKGALLTRIEDAGWTAEGKFLQVYDRSNTCRAMTAADFAPAGVPINEILYGFLQSLHELHSAGFVHGGVSPGAFISAENVYSINQYWTLHNLEGKPFYAPLAAVYPACLGAECMLFCAPEIYAGTGPRIASDVYSLAASVLYLVTGQHYALRDASKSPGEYLCNLIDEACPWLDARTRQALPLMLADEPTERGEIPRLLEILYPSQD